MLFLSGIYLPVVGMVLMLFTPQPGLVLENRDGKPSLASLVLVTAATVALAGGPRVAIFYLAGFALLTWVLASLLRGDWSIEATVGIATFVLGLTGLASVLLLFPSIGVITANLRETLVESWHFLVDAYRRSGMPADFVDQLTQGGDRFVDVVIGIAPGLAIVALGSIVLANVSLVRRRQCREGAVPVFGDLTLWSAPPASVWMLIVVGYASFLPWPVARTIAWNLLVVVLAVYLCQGLAIVQYAFRTWRVPAWARVLAYVLVAVEWLAGLAVVLLGVFDLWADFRRLSPRAVVEDDE